jgi:hypothetical protein
MANKKPLSLYSGIVQELTSGDNIDVNNGNIINLLDPTANGHAATKLYVDNRTNNDIRIHAALGGVALAETIPLYLLGGNVGAQTDGRMYFVAVWLEKAATLTGVKWYQNTQGAYTADNNNKIGLYTYSGGTMTLVASSTNDGNIWKAASNTWASKAFSATYAAAAGLFFIGFLYNSSAQTTAPVLGGTNINSAAATFDYTNSARISGYVNTQTDLPSSQAMSGLTINTMMPFFALY